MNVMVIEGFLGAGKTLLMSLLAKHYQERSGCTLYSNYGLIGAKPFTKMEDFLQIAQEPSSILTIDEGHMDLDARSFSSNHVKFFTQVSYYLRKLRCTMIITSPNFSDLDSRIRGITNIYCRVNKDAKYFYYTMYDVQSARYLKTLKIPKDYAFYFGSQIFDTTKMVTPIQIPATKGDYLEFLETLKSTSEEYESMKKQATA